MFENIVIRARDNLYLHLFKFGCTLNTVCFMGITEQSKLRKYVNWLMYVIDLIILATLTVMIATVSG